MWDTDLDFRYIGTCVQRPLYECPVCAATTTEPERHADWHHNQQSDGAA